MTMKNAGSSRTNARPDKARDTSSAIYGSVEELAQEIGISRQSAYTALRNNTIPHIRLGKRYILPKAAIAEWLRNPTAFDALAANSLRALANLGRVRQ
jgi:excisionase family DNA binding protein